MTKELDAKLKTALDESRLLILGAQVLFGFAFQGVFQELFRDVSPAGHSLQCAALVLLCGSVGLLIAPSMYHRIACNGQSRHQALHVTTSLTGWSLLPLTLGLGASVFVVFDFLAGPQLGAALGAGLAAIGLGLLFGLGMVLRHNAKSLPPESGTPLKTKIEQLLTEARVIIPGGQALLGFQFVAALTRSFQSLPDWMQAVHAAGLLAVAFSVLLLMTPASLHRLAYHGEDDPQFFRIGSALVIAAVLPLALGIAADIAVVIYVVSESARTAIAIGTTAFSSLLAVWYGFPLWHRRARHGTA
ncbi:hypothetical protein CK489_28480 [Bradyrhizobium sp. UFLA03-84]|uniref:DUF6328 family protein n=1 Tax=Bradyrhizobium sp. UFLA03-84 TaxID=418599 RepID=UPI000BADDEFD|nr:DUF6328 family protein [Bradyrhizobium sp. UFLA03-84]PAY06787.1 hypothetical protein CK489_28480 [Bradyrhizobium sp. UFLA03-84]